MRIELLFSDGKGLRAEASQEELRLVARKYLSELLARLGKEYPGLRIELRGRGDSESRFNRCTDRY